MFGAWALAPILAFWFLWQSGNSARWRDFLRRRMRAAWLYRGAFGATLGALAPVAELPFAFGSYRVAHSVGLTVQTIPNWFLDELLRLVIVSIITALIVVVILALVDCRACGISSSSASSPSPRSPSLRSNRSCSRR
jgi:hypothetical protein